MSFDIACGIGGSEGIFHCRCINQRSNIHHGLFISRPLGRAIKRFRTSRSNFCVEQIHQIAHVCIIQSAKVAGHLLGVVNPSIGAVNIQTGTTDCNCRTGLQSAEICVRIHLERINGLCCFSIEPFVRERSFGLTAGSDIICVARSGPATVNINPSIASVLPANIQSADNLSEIFRSLNNCTGGSPSAQTKCNKSSASVIVISV